MCVFVFALENTLSAHTCKILANLLAFHSERGHYTEGTYKGAISFQMYIYPMI